MITQAPPIGKTIWDLRTGERYTYCGPGGTGKLQVKNADGPRQIGMQHLSLGSRTALRKGSTMKVGDDITVELLRSIDQSTPRLPAKVIRINEVGKPVMVKVNKSAHRIWGECDLRIPANCKVVASKSTA